MPNFDFRLKKVKEQDDLFICMCRKSDFLYEFMAKLLFNLLKLSKNQKMKKKQILKIIKESQFGSSKVITAKNGYKCGVDQICNKLLNIPSFKEFLDYNRFNQITFLQLTSAAYVFQVSNDFITKCVQNNPKLKNKVIKSYREILTLPESFTFEDLEKTIAKSAPKLKQNKWGIPWILSYIEPSINNLIFKHQQNNEVYIRRKISYIDALKSPKLYTITPLDCLKYQYPKDVKQVVTGNTWYVPVDNGIWLNMIKKYKKHALAGPSGSTVLTSRLYLEYTGILKKTYENKVILLLIILCDFYPIHHSLDEILQQYAPIWGLPKYTLDMNNLEYLEKLMSKVPKLKKEHDMILEILKKK